MRHMKCKICGFEAGAFSDGVCIECQNRETLMKYKKQPSVVGEIKFKRREPIQLTIF